MFLPQLSTDFRDYVIVSHSFVEDYDVLVSEPGFHFVKEFGSLNIFKIPNGHLIFIGLSVELVFLTLVEYTSSTFLNLYSY